MRHCAQLKKPSTKLQINGKDAGTSKGTVACLRASFKVLPRVFLDLFIPVRPFLGPKDTGQLL